LLAGRAGLPPLREITFRDSKRLGIADRIVDEISTTNGCFPYTLLAV